MAALYEPIVTGKGQLGYNRVTGIQLHGFTLLQMLLTEVNKVPTRLAQSRLISASSSKRFRAEAWGHFDVCCRRGRPWFSRV
jgi:hypothetical protein